MQHVASASKLDWGGGGPSDAADAVLLGSTNPDPDPGPRPNPDPKPKPKPKPKPNPNPNPDPNPNPNQAAEQQLGSDAWPVRGSLLAPPSYHPTLPGYHPTRYAVRSSRHLVITHVTYLSPH